jgi:chromosome segregation ATPase
MDNSLITLIERKLHLKTIQALNSQKSPEVYQDPRISELNLQVNDVRSRVEELSEQLGEASAKVALLERDNRQLSLLVPLSDYFSSKELSPEDRVLNTLQTGIKILLDTVAKEQLQLEQSQRRLERLKDHKHKLEIELELLRDKDLKALVI